MEFREADGKIFTKKRERISKKPRGQSRVGVAHEGLPPRFFPVDPDTRGEYKHVIGEVHLIKWASSNYAWFDPCPVHN